MEHTQSSSYTNVPTIFVVFGATGDLMARKITPALFDLFSKKMLPDRFAIVGFARREFSDDEFRVRTQEILKKHFPEGNFSAFLEHVSYVTGNLASVNDYHSLARTLSHIDDAWGMCSNKLHYLAVPPDLLAGIFKNLSESTLTDSCGGEGGWTRVLVEKPFGKDLDTARRLDEMLAEYFKEEQIYRIDHYLAKEMLQNILAFRFSNDMFDANWDVSRIESIEIRLMETLDLKNRGQFYDGIGAFRDVGQNHLLQMLSFLTMDRPASFSAHDVRMARAKLLETLRIPTEDDVRRTTFRAQYDGYRVTEGVESQSETETYFLARAFLDHPRWRGVPITLEAGKAMHEQRKEMIVTYRHAMPCLCPHGAVHRKNHIIFRIEPDEEIKIHFWSKEPGFGFRLRERTLDFLLREKESRAQYVEEYEKLLLDCISGDQTAFVDTAEIAAMWRYTDPIVRAWQRNVVPLKTYKPHESIIAHNAERGELSNLPRTIGIIGLGKMGGNIARRLAGAGWSVTGFSRDADRANEFFGSGVTVTTSLETLIQSLPSPRIVWCMLPAGKIFDDIVFGERGILSMMKSGDYIIDGGNSLYKDSIARAEKLKKSGIHFIDVGVSGGPSGALMGAALMVGGQHSDIRMLEPLFQDIAGAAAWQFFEGHGAGHFVKMIHNGIEYGMMQAIAEGAAILRESQYRLDLTRVAEVYSRGTVIESRLISWLRSAFELHGSSLHAVSGTVGHTGEGAWTVDAARELGVRAKVIEDALQFRVESEKNPTYMGKVLSALREQFGGHSSSVK